MQSFVLPSQPEHISELVDKPDDILSFLDRSATDWPDGVAVAIYKLAKRCLDLRRRRPEISEVVNSIVIFYHVIQYKQYYFDLKNVFLQSRKHFLNNKVNVYKILLRFHSDSDNSEKDGNQMVYVSDIWFCETC